MNFFNAKSIAERLGIAESAVVQLISDGRLEMGEHGLVSEQALSNYLVEKQIDAEREHRDQAFAAQVAHDLRLFHERNVMLDVIHEAAPKLIAESRRRLAKLGDEPLPGIEKRFEDLAATAI